MAECISCLDAEGKVCLSCMEDDLRAALAAERAMSARLAALLESADYWLGATAAHFHGDGTDRHDRVQALRASIRATSPSTDNVCSDDVVTRHRARREEGT
jgi:hypothetical protein